MNKQPTARPPHGPSSSDNPCSKFKAQEANYYKPRQEQRADHYRPIYSHYRKENLRGSSDVRNARGEKYYNQSRRLEDDRRKKKKIEIRRSQREKEQYEKVRTKKREPAREQDQYEEERERQQDEEYCPCDRCWVGRREESDYKIHKWLAATEELANASSFKIY